VNYFTVFLSDQKSISKFITTNDSWECLRPSLLTGSHNNAARCYVAIWEDTVIGFASVITMPSGTVKNAWRGHRAVYITRWEWV
jgi:hypothetical protein